MGLGRSCEGPYFQISTINCLLARYVYLPWWHLPQHFAINRLRHTCNYWNLNGTICALPSRIWRLGFYTCSTNCRKCMKQQQGAAGSADEISKSQDMGLDLSCHSKILSTHIDDLSKFVKIKIVIIIIIIIIVVVVIIITSSLLSPSSYLSSSPSSSWSSSS